MIVLEEEIVCPVCNNSETELFFSRKNVPTNQNFLISDKNSALSISTGNLKLHICPDCSFIFNSDFDLSKVNYGNLYENSQDISPLFNDHLEKLVKKIVLEKNVTNSTIVEVGCGKGVFLNKLVNYPDSNNFGYGFDPSYTGETLDEGNIKFFKKFYDFDSSEIKTDFVVCRHVIEHIPKPIDLLKTIRDALSKSNNPRVFFETPDVNWILKNNVIWDFFYEHCSYFNPTSIRKAFEIAGFKIESIENIFQNQYMLIEATISEKETHSSQQSDKISELAKNFSSQEEENKKTWQSKIKTLSKNGVIAIWGAGAKGVTFLNLFDHDSQYVDCVIDINPKKCGKFIPGTGHSIISPNEIKKKNITDIIIMNPNYFEEIKSKLTELRLKINLII